MGSTSVSSAERAKCVHFDGPKGQLTGHLAAERLECSIGGIALIEAERSLVSDGEKSHSTRRAVLLGAVGLGLSAFGQRTVRAAEVVENYPLPVRDPSTYTAYIPTACKVGQFHWYTCEFDAAWAVMKTFGIEASFDEQIATIGIDDRLEPYYQSTEDGFFIYGGDIGASWCGDYTHNLLARTTGLAMRKVFKHFGMRAGRIRSRRGIRQSIDAGRLVWIKATVDFLDFAPATWVTPEGATYPGVLGNDHAMIVIGYDADVVVIRDVLGPTDTNWNRAFEYEVDWQTFMYCWSAQGKDGLAVGPQ